MPRGPAFSERHFNNCHCIRDVHIMYALYILLLFVYFDFMKLGGRNHFTVEIEIIWGSGGGGCWMRYRVFILLLSILSLIKKKLFILYCQWIFWISDWWGWFQFKNPLRVNSLLSCLSKVNMPLILFLKSLYPLFSYWNKKLCINNNTNHDSCQNLFSIKNDYIPTHISHLLLSEILKIKTHYIFADTFLFFCIFVFI